MSCPWWRLLIGLLLAALTVLSLAPPARGQEPASHASAAPSYLSLDPVREWDIDLIYRYHREEAQEVSLLRGYQVRGERQIQEFKVVLRRRMASGWVGVLHVPFVHSRVREAGWVLGPAGWEPFRWEEAGWEAGTVGLGWRREGSWRRRGDTEWGADIFLEGGRGWTVVPRWRWKWLRDPVLLRIGLEAPWKLRVGEGGRAEPLSLEVGIDHAVNSRLVVSGGLALQAGRLVPTWGWSWQVLPNQYWNVQIYLPAHSPEVNIQTGWRLRL